MRPLCLVVHVFSWRERYVQNYVFAFCACGWSLVLSTKLLAGKVCFYVFMYFENEPVDKALVPTIIHVCHSGAGAFSGDHCGYLSLDVLSILMVHFIVLFVLHPVGRLGWPYFHSSYPFC